jgi:hypothetical protein
MITRQTLKKQKITTKQSIFQYQKNAKAHWHFDKNQKVMNQTS